MFIIKTALSFRIMRNHCLPRAPIFSYVHVAKLTACIKTPQSLCGLVVYCVRLIY